MENRGVEVVLSDRGERGRGKQEMPDRLLQLAMLEDALDNNGAPALWCFSQATGGLPERVSQNTGVHAPARLAHRDSIVGAFLLAISVCASGLWKMGHSYHWMTSMVLSPIWNYPAPVSRSPIPAMLNLSIYPIARWQSFRRLRQMEQSPQVIDQG